MSLAATATATCLYALFILHAALFGGGGPVMPDAAAIDWAAALAWPRHVSRADLLVNVVGYAPFGFMLAQWIVRAARRRAGAVPSGLGYATRVAILATAGATLLSAGTELLQTGIPGRVSSLLDVLANGAGAAAGALVRPVFHHAFDADGRLSQATYAAVDRAASPRLALAALATWLLDRLWPLAFTLDLGVVRAGLRALKAWWTGHAEFQAAVAAQYAGLWLPALLLCAMLLARRAPRALLLALFAGAVLAAKPLAGRSVRIEELCAAALAYGAAMALLRIPPRARAAAGAGVALATLAATQLASHPLAGTVGGAFQWMPFALMLRREDLGIAPLLTLGAVIGPLAWFAWRLSPPTRGRVVASAAALALVLAALEVSQVGRPGRHGDITVVIAGVALWWAWAACARADHRAALSVRRVSPGSAASSSRTAPGASS